MATATPSSIALHPDWQHPIPDGYTLELGQWNVSVYQTPEGWRTRFSKVRLKMVFATPEEAMRAGEQEARRALLAALEALDGDVLEDLDADE